MARGRLYLVAPLVALGLFGCRAFNFEEREPWRAQAEEQCMAQRLVQASAFAAPGPEISGPGICGMNHPFKIQAALEGYVGVQPQATLGCPMTAAFNKWVTDIVQPAAQAWFGEQIVEVKQLSSFSCRRIGGSGNMSEHGFGNALDVSAFTFQSGRIVIVKHGWRGTPEERGYLRQIHAGACEVFTTVLGPGYDAAHHDHFHLDLARRNAVVCRPEPQMISPPPGPRGYPENVPMVRRVDPQRFPIARAPQAQPELEEDDEEQPQRFPVARAPRQPITPDQSYPPPRAPQQQNAPMVLNPQDPGNYPPPARYPEPPQYQQAPQPMQAAPAYPQAPPYQPPQQYPPAYQPPTSPAYQPPSNPNRLTPPGRIGNLKNADPVVTGAIKNRKHYKDAPAPKHNLPKAVPGED